VRPAHSDHTRTATDDTVLRVGDVILAVGRGRSLDQFQRIVGRVAEVDLLSLPGRVGFRRVLVTRREVLGLTVDELGLDQRFGVTVTRVTRADMEMTAVPEMKLQFGDQLLLVGEEADLTRATEAVGNSLKELNATHFVPVFTGIALGVLAGWVPISVPGLPVPVRLGIAGGPLILALILSRIGHFGPLVWHMPMTANLAFRELGITLFLACVGLKAGRPQHRGHEMLAGLQWLAAGALLTLVPLLLAAAVGHWVFRLRFVTLSGLLAGAMTDPPALAFACAIARADAPNVAYATVYPLTVVLRILCAQVLALWLCG
jgi:putative transport protein